MDRLFRGNPDRKKARALALLEAEHWMDARLACDDLLDRLPEDDPDRSRFVEGRDRAADELARVHIESAEAYRDAGDFEAATDRVELALELATRSATRRKASAVLRGRRKKNPAADTTLEIHARDRDLMEDSGVDEEMEAVFSAQGDRDEAYRVHGAPLGRALMAAMENRDAAARKALQKLRKQHPADPVLSFELGRILNKMKQPKQAIPHLAHAVETDPDRDEAVIELAVAHIETGQPGGALDTVAAYTGDRQRVYELHAEILVAMGRTEDAWSLLEGFLDSPRESPAMTRMLGQLAAAKGDTKTAGRLFERAWQRGAQDPQNTLALASFLEELGDDLVRVVELYNGLADQDEANRHFYFRKVGSIYLKQGHRREAREILGRALALAPPGAREQRKEIEALLGQAAGGD